MKEITYSINNLNREIEEAKRHSQELLSRDGGTCSVCYGVIDKKNFKHVLGHNIQKAEENKKQVANLNNAFSERQSALKKMDQSITTLQEAYTEAKAKDVLLSKSIRELEQRKSIAETAFRKSANSVSLLLEQKINNYQEQIAELRQKIDPYDSIIEQTNKELFEIRDKAEEQREEIVKLEKMVPYYQYWVKAFGDDGIRSFVLEEVIPILNSRINYWLQFLIDNKISLKFNNELEEKIERLPADGDEFVYNAMSGGERQRIDLGISFAFAQVMMLTAGSFPSLVCLDEVGTNLDRPGIQSVYNTICELSRERQVLVITHDPDLQQMLSIHDTIKIVKENNFSHIEI